MQNPSYTFTGKKSRNRRLGLCLKREDLSKEEEKDEWKSYKNTTGRLSRREEREKDEEGTRKKSYNKSIQDGYEIRDDYEQ